MDEAEARARCAELSENSPERTTHSWIPREQVDGSWNADIFESTLKTPNLDKWFMGIWWEKWARGYGSGPNTPTSATIRRICSYQCGT